MKTSSGGFRLTVMVLAITVLAGCTSTRPTAEWLNQDFAGKRFDNILIIGVSDRQAVRRSFEDAFVAVLQEEGIRAVSSAEVMPPGAGISRQTLDPVVEEQGLDAVLITHLVGVEAQEVYSPPRYRGGLYRYHGAVTGYVYEPGYYRRYNLYKLETNLYDADTASLVWSMQSETVDPGSEQKLIDAKIDTVVKRLGEQGLL